jgi:hypothetical protein
MTLKELEQSSELQLGMNGWLREIAIQLALLNEKGEAPNITESTIPEVVTQELPIKRKPGRPPKQR